MTGLRIAVHVLGWLPLAALLLDLAANRLSVNPIQEVEQRLGRTALYFLLASLAVTPLVTLTGGSFLAPRRRALGVYAFLYAGLHFAVFLGLDYGFDLVEVGRLVLEKPYILVGTTTGLILLALAATSFDRLMRRMGRRWKRLHRLAYAAGGLAVLHYAWARKGDLFNLRGDILAPLLWGLLLAALLLLRLPAVRRWIGRQRGRLRFGH